MIDEGREEPPPDSVKTVSAPEVQLLAECQSADLPSPSFFTSAQWTADGTAVISGSSDQSVHAFVLPDDLLEEASRPRNLSAQAVTKLPEPPQAIAPAPYFNLGEPATQTFLVSYRDHPIHLYHAFPDEGHTAPLASYKLIRAETEEYLTPSSLLWQYPGTHFLCGSSNRLDLFDASGHASGGPITTIPTIPSRRHTSKGGGVGMKGTVSALSASPPNSDGGSIVAAGTWTRWVGLYDLNTSDKVVANWSIQSAAESLPGLSHSSQGSGIAQTIWSPCGRYLLINERHSESLLVYDIRVTGQLLSALRGREAATQQRLHCDVYAGEDGGFEVWAGAQNGMINVWEAVGLHGDMDARPSWSWKAHDAPVGATGLHSSGSVVATCSGGWEHAYSYERSDSLSSSSTSPSPPSSPSILETRSHAPKTHILEESSLKFWSITASKGHINDT